jgi:hypothetical protein
MKEEDKNCARIIFGHLAKVAYQLAVMVFVGVAVAEVVLLEDRNAEVIKFGLVFSGAILCMGIALDYLSNYEKRK